MINFDCATEESIKDHNPNWRQIPDHRNRILITGIWIRKKIYRLT